MTRTQLEHIIRAACQITDDRELIIVGSQAILGQFPNPPDELSVSNEVDVYPKNFPERADLIDGTIGELSPFHETFGYYAQGVGPNTATLPSGWEERLIMVRNENTLSMAGLCIEAHDLVISKCVAARPKDDRYVLAAIRHGLVDPEVLRERLRITPVGELRDAVRARLERRITEAASERPLVG